MHPAVNYLFHICYCKRIFFFFCRPQHGGKFCQGSSRIYQLCNTQLCASNSPDFRAQQCAEYNSKPFRGWYYKWKPYIKVEGEPVKIRIYFGE